MLSHKDLSELWGDENVVQLSGSTVDRLNIPEAAKAFLKYIGAPAESELEITIDTKGLGWPTLSEYCRLTGARAPTNASRYYRIGNDADVTDLCIDRLDNGAVVSIDLRGELPERFVNSGVDKLIECLYLYGVQARLARGLRDDQTEAMIPLFEEKLRRIDPKALENEENWWSVVLEQIRDGLL